MNLADIHNRLAKVEKQTNSNSQILRELGQKFAWYWRDERRRAFAIVSRIVKDKAELVVFDGSWSGGFTIVDDSPMFIENPAEPLDEQIKEGHWQPMVDLEDILDAALKLPEFAEAVGGQTRATATDTAAA